MRRLLLLAAALAACSRGPAPGKAAYEPADRSFSLEAPGDWRVEEAPGRAAFFGPARGPRPWSESIAVSRVEGSAEAYHARQAALGGATPMSEDGKFRRFEGVRQGPSLHGRPPETLAVKHVLVPAKDGWWALVHTYPSGGAPDPAFEALVKSFRARSD